MKMLSLYRVTIKRKFNDNTVYLNQYAELSYKNSKSFIWVTASWFLRMTLSPSMNYSFKTND